LAFCSKNMYVPFVGVKINLGFLGKLNSLSKIDENRRKYYYNICLRRQAKVLC
jgi:hypothetical protein